MSAINYSALVRASSIPVAGTDDAGPPRSPIPATVFIPLQRACPDPLRFKVHEIGIVKNDRLDRALDLVAFMTVRGNDVQDFTEDSNASSNRSPAE